MISITCLFIGGPFDGGELDLEPDEDLPTYWWLRPDPDGEYDFFARADRTCGGERYILSAFNGGLEAAYQHETLRQDVGTRPLRAYA